MEDLGLPFPTVSRDGGCEAQAAMSSSALAVYIDLLPLAESVFADWRQAESLCRSWVERLESAFAPDAALELVVRQAVAGLAEGFAVTAYLSARGRDRAAAAAALAVAMKALAASIPSLPPATAVGLR
jgi:hypothetical protein